MVRHNKGFSLVELLVSIAIIGILTAIATASYTTMQKKARDSKRISDVKALQHGFEQYFSDVGSYPTGDGCTTGTTYFPNGYPLDPQSGLSYSFSCTGGTAYCVCATMEVESGNAPTNCAAVTGTYYCVHEVQ